MVAGRKWTIWQGKNEHFCHSVVTPPSPAVARGTRRTPSARHETYAWRGRPSASDPGLHGSRGDQMPPEYQDVGKSHEPTATFLGLFSIGLGLWELAAPRSVGR